jgi:hypothetical protein
MDQTQYVVLNEETTQRLKKELLALLGLTHAPENAVHKVKIDQISNRTVFDKLQKCLLD